MADENVDNPFLDLTRPDAGDAELPRSQPISDEERLIVQNLFDTQPARRAAYMRKIGLELDPKDDNRYRPLGSNGKFDAEIDPGVLPLLGKGQWRKAMAEALKDGTIDVAWDTAEGAALAQAAGGGGTAGAALGATAGPVGAAGGAILGAVVGGGLGKAASEIAKAQVGDLLLDKNVPVDKQALVIQSLMSGVAPQVIKGAMAGGKAGVLKILEKRKEALTNIAKQTGGLDDAVIEKAVKNPDMFSKEAVKGASEKLGAIYKNIMGIAPDEQIDVRTTRQIRPDSVLGKAVEPLNREATLEVNKLAQMPEANWKVGELLQPLRRQVSNLSSKFDRTADEEQALAYLKNKITEIETNAARQAGKRTTEFTENVPMRVFKDAAPEAYDPNAINAIAKNPVESELASATQAAGTRPITRPIDRTGWDELEINFKEGRDILKSIQDDAFNREVPGNSYLRQAVGGGQGQLRDLADKKAAAAGSNLGEINAKRSEILGAFNDLKANITPAKITSAYIGNDGVAKAETRRALGKLDKIAGSNFTEAIEDGQMQRVVENMYNTNPAFASGRSNSSMVSGAISGAMKGAGAGAGIGGAVGGAPGIVAGAKIGGLGGAALGALQAADRANIKNVFPQIGSLDQSIANAQAFNPSSAMNQAVAQDVARPLVNTLNTSTLVQPTPAEAEKRLPDDNPFSDL
jgi:hypothetical protein